MITRTPAQVLVYRGDLHISGQACKTKNAVRSGVQAALGELQAPDLLLIHQMHFCCPLMASCINWSGKYVLLKV